VKKIFKMIQIANPIYDVVFKYLMSDNKVAKLMLSTIIGQEILELQFDPTETTSFVQGAITVLRMDFKARIKYEDGSENVIIIEIQKAKLHTDIMRFRRYLGEQYLDKNNSIVRETYTAPDGTTYEKRDGLPILSIYFLGYPLDFAKDIPVIKVARKYIDVATGEEILKKEKFIESLTHDSFVIQIPYIHGHRRTELEQLLYIFDQNNAESDKVYKQFLTIEESEVPERYRPVIRQLLKAFANPKVRNQMNAEEEIIAELQDYERQIGMMNAEIETKNIEIAAKEVEIAAKEAAIEEKEVEIQKKNAAIEAKDAEIEKQKQEIQANIKRMLQANISVEQVAELLNQPIELIQSISEL
jgi:hypothetical protein